MRFIGCKENLLPFLDDFVRAKGINGGVFCDLFAGTASVGRHFKQAGFRVLSTDLLYFSFVLQKVYLELSDCPRFANLAPLTSDSGRQGDIFASPARGAMAALDHLNDLDGEDGFMFRHYSPEGTSGTRYVRRYFTAANARKIDAIRARIAQWKESGLINEDEFYYLLCALIEAVPFVSNISGTYSAFLKSWDARALKSLRLVPPALIHGKAGKAANADGVEFIAQGDNKIDVLYLDPPYNGRQYAPNYHILETIARWDAPEVRGVSGMRDYQAQKSAFCNRRGALAAFDKILDRAACRHIIVSYNEDGIVDKSELLALLRRHGRTEVVERDYQRFKSNGGAAGRTRVKERLYYAKSIHPKNRLNDLSGDEWVYFLKSVETTNYSTKGKDGFAHHLRRIHPSPKPPQLMRQFVEFFTKEKQSVLDPFMGVGGVLLACSLAGRSGFGVDLSSKYVERYRAVCRELDIKEQRAVVGDSAHLRGLLKGRPLFDLVLTDPPYGEMLSRKRTGQRKKETGIAAATPFTEEDDDLGNMPREQFFNALTHVIAQASDLLKPKGYIVIFAKDLQPDGKTHNMLHCAVVDAILQIPGLAFRGYKIWHDQTPKLYPFGYPHAFVANQLHQFALIFRKEEQ